MAAGSAHAFKLLQLLMVVFVNLIDNLTDNLIDRVEGSLALALGCQVSEQLTCLQH
jgi:hypothetical protein